MFAKANVDVARKDRVFNGWDSITIPSLDENSHMCLCNHTPSLGVTTATIHHPTPNTLLRPRSAISSTLNSTLEPSRTLSKLHTNDNDTVTAGSVEQSLQWIVRSPKTFNATVPWLVSFGASMTNHFKCSPSSLFYLYIGPRDYLTVWPKLFRFWYSTRSSTTIWAKPLLERSESFGLSHT